ncbi:LEAF RUST 10 DISEASE-RESISTANCEUS RECEPTOR-LIKE PROTEIN KINASE-like 1.2 isoform X1 [Euphorbia lathyris]|uniref:LEAF RUST 10 DISEASE-RESISTANCEUS RECEPTOR-LIKE PROTEIN KINASE-like 1.2 isoform X1 n=1 Tax=Euphorbia lathyris TaxID=212925 RepID=UPI00331411F5
MKKLVAYLFQSCGKYSITMIIFFILLILAPSSYCQEDKYYSECVKPFDCGNLKNLSYPFWRDGRSEICGFEGFKLLCVDDAFPAITIENKDFLVVSVNQSQKEMAIARMDLLDDPCPDDTTGFTNITLTSSPFSFVPDFYTKFSNITLFYNCTGLQNSPLRFVCSVDGEEREAFYGYDGLWMPECTIKVWIPVPKTSLGLDDLGRVLRQGFNVSYKYEEDCVKCSESGGICGTNLTNPGFTCLCPGHPYPDSCPKKTGSDPNIKLKVGIGLGASFGSVAIMCILFFIYIRRKKKDPYAPSSFVSQTNTSDFSSKYDMERGGSVYGVQLFTYEQLEEATNNFDSKKELGEGGFGTVYHGKLQDGRSVAVKRLYENNYKRAEQFMNEVDLLTHLRHPHLVSLYGCTSRHSRELLLVYEYISNGTVADHVHGERAKPGALPWHTRMNIAVETASALAYLHRSDIIHRDVKTNNILLDDNFCVKVADFGLSRLFPLHVTHVSTAPQGTPGYVDPEYHECYQLTSKSDVYSFGVVLIELISSMPAVDITRHRHEINLSTMAVNKIQSNALDELVDHSLGFDSDYAVRKMINAVAELAFQCLQSGKELRPTMDEVLETLMLIKNKDYDLEKKEEMDTLSDDVGLLKSDPPLHSPDSVMIKWKSTATTPNASG